MLTTITTVESQGFKMFLIYLTDCLKFKFTYNKAVSIKNIFFKYLIVIIKWLIIQIYTVLF